jgi:DNA (cytosine-5)-methyltransferase 1
MPCTDGGQFFDNQCFFAVSLMAGFVHKKSFVLLLFYWNEAAIVAETYLGEGHLMTEFSHLRQQAGLTVAEAAEITGYAERTVYRWENGSPARKAALDVLRSMRPANDEREPAFEFIDLFAGIGGLRRGFESIGGKCVFTSEWDKYAQITYCANFPDDDHDIHGDIRAVPSDRIPRHDVLLAGFPCQPFSIAGVSKKNALKRPHGFACDTQGTLFFEVQRIIHDKKPVAFVLENVKNLLNHDKGRTFRIIHQVLTEELGYFVSWQVLDAKSWVPQHRERVFIVGFKKDYGFDLKNMPVPDAADGPKLGEILQGPNDPVDERYTLTTHLWNYLKSYAAKHQAKGNGFGYGLCGPNDVTRTLSARYYKDGSEILIDQGTGKPPRRLTPRECARLMGFDRSGADPMKIKVSDTQAYKQFGNSVVVPVVEAVAKYMEASLRRAVADERAEASAT